MSPCLRGESKGLGRPLRIVWEGSQALLSSLARVNRELCLGLVAGGDVELSLREPRVPWAADGEPLDARLRELLDRRLSGPPDVTVRHFFPPDWRRPAQGRLIVMQPWEYGYQPAAWVEGARQADEIWAYSRFVRDVYVRSGVPAEKVRIVPLGFAPEVFFPTHAPIHSRIQTPTTFLFVGGVLDRKGADLLLEAYRRAFTPADAVRLVVKDMGTRTFYPDNPLSAAFREAAASAPPLLHSSFPPIEYLDSDLTDPDLAALYRSASCLVLPYRGEGFALPPLEAMACGVMPVVTAGGPTDDYLDDTVASRLPARRVPLGSRTVGAPELGLECVADPWLLEPNLEALVEALRWVHTHPEEVRRRGALAAQRAQAWTWSAAAVAARERLERLVCPQVPARAAGAQPWFPAAA
jgi:glycosyltransferase involved in cell wall biosynthesis